jgi:hypothetical protein
MSIDAKNLKQSVKALNDLNEIPIIQMFVAGMTGPNAGGQQVAFESQKHEKFVMGGNHSGKTYYNVMQGALFMIPEKAKGERGNLQPTGWAINPYQRRRIPPDGMLGWFSTYSNEVQKSALQIIVDKVLKPYWIGEPLKENGAYQQVKTEGGLIQFKWQTAGKSTYESAKCDWVGFDEPHDPVIYGEGKERTSLRNGYVWTTATLVQNVDDPDFWKRQRMINWLVDTVLKPLEDTPDEFALKFPDTDVIYIHADENKYYSTSKESRDARHATMSDEERYVRETGRVLNVSAYSLFSVEMLDAIKKQIDAGDTYPDYGVIIYDEQETNNELKFTFESTDIHKFPDRPREGWALKIWEHPVSTALGICPGYVMGVDCAEGRKGGDYSCAYVRRIDTGQVVANIHGYIDESDISLELWKLGWYYKDSNNQPAMIAVEVNNAGKTTLSNLIKGNANVGLPIPYPRNRLYRRPNIKNLARNIHAPSDEFGWHTNTGSRRFLLTAMREIFIMAYRNIQYGISDIPDKAILDEAKSFIKDDSGKYKAASGYHDDRILSLAISEMVRKQQNKQTKSAFLETPKAETNGAYIYQDGKVYWNWDKVEKKLTPVPAYV